MILILWSFTHPVPDLHEFLSSAEHKRRLLAFKQLTVAIDIFFYTMEVNGDQQLFGYQHS